MDWGVVFAFLLTLIILCGPFPRAIQDRDYHEVIFDIVFIIFIWLVYFIVSNLSFDWIVNRLLY